MANADPPVGPFRFVIEGVDLDLSALGLTLDTETTAKVWGIGRDHLYRLVRDGEAPIEPLRLGRCLRWPTVKVLALVGIEV